MYFKTLAGGAMTIFLFILFSSFTMDAPVLKYSPAGSWEYSAPGVEPGYETGTMIITEDGRNYKVTMALNEYFKVEAENVVYKRKALSFTIWVETEEIVISGTFSGDNFNAKISYFEGDFDMTAVRTVSE
jgi:hypothetical protein